MSKKRSNNWLFGYGCHIDFSTGSPVAQTALSHQFSEGCDSVSDPITGELLFYTNGNKIYNASHDELDANISGLNSDLAMQAITIARKPGSDEEYYLLFVGNWAPAVLNAGDINYRTYNTGTETLGGLNTLEAYVGYVGYNENLTIAKHSNGTDLWIITKQRGSADYKVWPLTSGGIGTVVTSGDAGATIFPDLTAAGISGAGTNKFGQIKVSPDGSKVLLGLGTLDAANHDCIVLSKFDNATGAVSESLVVANSATTSTAKKVVGVDFASHSRILYATTLGTGSTQYLFRGIIWGDNYVELTSFNMSSIVTAASSAGEWLGVCQLGPDGRLYISVRAGTKLVYFDKADVEKFNNPETGDNTFSLTDVKYLDLTATTESKLGLPVVPQEVFTTDIKDYRIYYDGVWYSVCNADVIKLYNQETGNFKEIAEGDKYYNQFTDSWDEISCTLPTYQNYTAYDIIEVATGMGGIPYIHVTENLTGILNIGDKIWVRETTNFNVGTYNIAASGKTVSGVTWDGVKTIVDYTDGLGARALEASGKLIIEA